MMVNIFSSNQFSLQLDNLEETVFKPASRHQQNCSTPLLYLRPRMEYLLLALLLAKLSFQLPHPSSDTVALHPRGSSAHSFGLTRVAPYISTVDASSSGPIKDVDAPKGLRRSKYLFPVTVEDQDFNLEIDTGSSDTWIIATNFECYYTYNRATDTFSGPLDQSACNFGATYTPGSGFQPLPPLYQLSSYGQSGEGTVRAVRGPFGKASISLGDITVQQQLIGAPNQVRQDILTALRPLANGFR